MNENTNIPPFLGKYIHDTTPKDEITEFKEGLRTLREQQKQSSREIQARKHRLTNDGLSLSSRDNKLNRRQIRLERLWKRIKTANTMNDSFEDTIKKNRQTFFF